MKLFVIVVLSTCLFTACGFDVVNAEDDYAVPTYDTYTPYDWYQSSSSTVIPSQTYNNYGTGTIVVNNGYVSSSSAIYTYSSSNVTDNNVAAINISSVKFELSGNYLYGTNLTGSTYKIEAALHGTHPENAYMRFGPYLSANSYVHPENKCITLTAISFYESQDTYLKGKLITSWTGTLTICE